MAQERRGAPASYPDGRVATTLRMDAEDQGPVLRHGEGPGRCDVFGAREAIVFPVGDSYFLHYDGAGDRGWLACLAVSKDLEHWERRGPVLDLGVPGARDAGTASSPWTFFDGKSWHMFYVGCRTTTPPPGRIPAVPYFILKAKAPGPDGPWTKQPDVVPLEPKPGSYFADTVTPGPVCRQGDEFLMVFSAAQFTDPARTIIKRTLGIARTRDLDGSWTADPLPILPQDHQVENAAVFFEPTNRTWFLFTNHVGLDAGGEYTESLWVYWSPDLDRWDPDHRAVVLDSSNCRWNVRSLGMPSAVRVGDRLALLYDAPAQNTGDLGRDVGLAWLKLPLRPPLSKD